MKFVEILSYIAIHLQDTYSYEGVVVEMDKTWVLLTQVRQTRRGTATKIKNPVWVNLSGAMSVEIILPAKGDKIENIKSV